MRHRKRSVRFGRQRSHYKATLRHLACSLIVNKSIVTTKTKAKEASRLADRLVTYAKEDSVHNRRKAYSILCDRNLVSILFNEIAPLFINRNGGYTRIILTRRRKGDDAQMAILEFVEKPKAEPLKQKKEKTPPAEEKRPAKKPVEKEEPEKEVKRPEPEQKPGFFRRFFRRKKDK